MASNYKGPDNIPELSNEAINRILNNVYDACDTEPNKIPIESLISYSSYRKERHLFTKILTLVVLIIFVLVPLLFVSPKFDVTQTGDEGAPRYVIDVHTFLPISVVSAKQEDGSSLVVYESGVHQYTIQPVSNGTIDLDVILLNRQYQTDQISVTTLDSDAPTFEGHKTEDDIVYIYVKDKDSGIDYEEVYALTTSGETVLPVDYDEDKGYVAFAFPDETLNVYIPDFAGNTLNLLVSI